MKTIIRRSMALLLGLSLLTGSLALTGCADRGPTLAELEGNEISVNLYQFMLSRVKGTLSRAGYSVGSDAFWDTIVDANNTTYDEYFRQAALTDTRRYLAALVLFEEYDLTLPESEYDRIDKELEEYVRDAGSKSEFNAELAGFGVNYDLLRDFYIIEAKFNYVRDHIYGKNGAKVAAQVRQEYLEKNAVAFRHVLIRSFDYVYETDENGDDIYFLPNQNNAKVNNIAYDKKNGTVRLDEYGDTIVDHNKDIVYFLESGRIAYDKETGVRAIEYDEQGIAKTVKYSAAELSEHKATAEEILATVEPGDYPAFEALLAEYTIDDDDAFVTDGELCFLYTSGDNAYDYLNDIADTLAAAEVGELKNVYSSEYGYNVVMKYPIPSDAVTSADYEDWFTDLTTRVVAELFHTMCEPYMDQVKVDDEAFAALPSMKDVDANLYY